MRFPTRAMLPAAMVAVLLFLTLQPAALLLPSQSQLRSQMEASAQDIQATPVTEESSPDVKRSSTLQDAPASDHEVTYTLPPAGSHVDTSQPVTVGADVTPGIAGHLRLTVLLNGGGFHPLFERDVPAGETRSFTYTIEPDVLQQHCIDGTIDIGLRALIQREGEETILAGITSGSHSCGIGPAPPLTPVIPNIDRVEINEVCGPNNDEITFDQEGVSYSVGAWEDGSATVTFAPAEGYYFPDGTVTTHDVSDGAIECDQPTAQFTYPEELLLLTSESDVTVTVTYDLNDEWQGGIGVTSDGSIGNSTSTNKFQISEPAGSLDLNFGVSNGTNLADECALSEGMLSAKFDIDFQMLTGRVWFDEVEDQIPCTVSVAPDTPTIRTNVCGPDNNSINIPTPPNGVIVNEGTWANGERTVTYTAADWAVFPDGFKTSYTFTDNQPCEATALFTGPTSLYLIDENSKLTITGEYDVTSLMPVQGEFEARFNGAFTTDRIGYYFSGPIETDPDSPANTFSFTTFLTGEDLMEYCPDTGYEGTLILHAGITFYDVRSPTEYNPILTHEQTMEIPCTVAFTPAAASISNDVCGLADERIIVPWQWQIVDHSISWEGNVATITYDVRPGFEVVGGPYTLTVTENPCITEPVPDPVHDPVCGIENDQITLGADVEGVQHTTSDGWVDGVYSIWVTPLPGWALPDGTQTEWTFTDTGDCVVTPIPPEALTAVCGPNNDILSIPVQPDGVIIEDSGWVENERTLTLSPAEGYAFPDNTPRALTSIDQNIACEVDPETTTLVVTFETSDGGSLEGESFSLHAPVASQTLQEPLVEGEIGPGNQVVIEDLIAGTYRLVAHPEGYEPVDEIIEVTATSASEEHLIAVSALQPAETPTPEPTIESTPQPAIESTQQPTTGTTDTDISVTGLPETGSGSSGGTGILALAGLLAAIVLGAVGRHRKLMR